MTIVLMLIAAGIGAVLRSLLGKTISERTKGFPIPLGMAAVNLLGSFGLGIFTGLGLDNPSARHHHRDGLFRCVYDLFHIQY